MPTRCGPDWNRRQPDKTVEHTIGLSSTAGVRRPTRHRRVIRRALRASCTSRDNLECSASCSPYVRSCERSLRSADLAVQGRGSHRQLSDARFRETAGRGAPRETAEKRFRVRAGAAFAHQNVLFSARESRTGQRSTPASFCIRSSRMLKDFASACALDFFAEVSEQLLPAAEPNEKYFRLITAVLDHLRTGNASSAQAEGTVVRDKQTWRAVTYFSVWAVKLAGLLPELHVCLGCGTWLDDPEKAERAWFSRASRGPALPRLPPRARYSQRLGTVARIARHRRGNPAHAHRAITGAGVDAVDRGRPAPFPRPTDGIPDRAKTDHIPCSRSRRLKSDMPQSPYPHFRKTFSG